MTPDDAELLAWVDGELDAGRADAVARAVANDADLARVAETLRRSRLPVREAYELAGHPPLPEALESAVRALVETSPSDERNETGDAGASRSAHGGSPTSRGAFASRGDAAAARTATGGSRSTAYGRLVPAAAAAVLALGVGLLGHELGRHREALAHASPIAANGVIDGVVDEAALWARRVAEYQSLYVRATVDGARPDPARTDRLLGRLAARDGLDPRVPALDEAGYRFVRVQELGWRDEPLVQLVYLGDTGPPLALCFMPDEGADREPAIETHAGLATAHWRRDGQRFVLVGDLSPSELAALSRRVDDAWSARG